MILRKLIFLILLLVSACTPARPEVLDPLQAQQGGAGYPYPAPADIQTPEPPVLTSTPFPTSLPQAPADFGYPGYPNPNFYRSAYVYPAPGADGRVALEDALASLRTWVDVRVTPQFSADITLAEIPASGLWEKEQAQVFLVTGGSLKGWLMLLHRQRFFHLGELEDPDLVTTKPWFEVQGPTPGGREDASRSCEWTYNRDLETTQMSWVHGQVVECAVYTRDGAGPAQLNIVLPGQRQFYTLVFPGSYRNAPTSQIEYVSPEYPPGLAPALPPQHGLDLNGLALNEEDAGPAERLSMGGYDMPSNPLDQGGGLTHAGVLEANNAILAGFGYRLEPQEIQGQPAFSLLRALPGGAGDEVILEEIYTLYPVVADERNGSIHDFALVAQAYGPGQPGHWLVRKDGLASFSLDEAYGLPPVFVGGRLVTLAGGQAPWDERLAPGKTVIVQVDGNPVFRYRITWPGNGGGLGLFAWQDRWVLEVMGTLVVDGQVWNQEGFAASEIFGFQMIEGRPFFLFKRDGVYGLWYDGQEAGVGYDEIPHWMAFQTSWRSDFDNFRLRAGPWGAFFYGRRGEQWLRVQVGKWQ